MASIYEPPSINDNNGDTSVKQAGFEEEQCKFIRGVLRVACMKQNTKYDVYRATAIKFMELIWLIVVVWTIVRMTLNGLNSDSVDAAMYTMLGLPVLQELWDIWRSYFMQPREVLAVEEMTQSTMKPDIKNRCGCDVEHSVEKTWC